MLDLFFVIYISIVQQSEELLFECNVGRFRDFIVADNDNLLILLEKGCLLFYV
jgi:hypothetical protein